MIKKTIELEHEIGDEIVVRVLCQRGIVSAIAIYPNDRIRYQVEYGGGGVMKHDWMDVFEIEKPKNNTIGFVKEKEGDTK